MTKTVAVALSFALALASTDARGGENDVQLWPAVTLNHGFGEQWGAHVQARFRADENVSRADDVMARGFISWRPNDALHLRAGYDYLYSFHSDSEHRPWQSAEHRFPWRELTLRNRLRLDERLKSSASGVQVRLRHRLRGEHPIASSSWYGVLSNEVMFNLNEPRGWRDKGFDQNRVLVALGAEHFERLRIEAGYEWQYVAQNRGGDLHRHVFVIDFSIDTGTSPVVPWSQD